MLAPSIPRTRFETKAVDLGACLVGGLDDVVSRLVGLGQGRPQWSVTSYNSGPAGFQASAAPGLVKEHDQPKPCFESVPAWEFVANNVKTGRKAVVRKDL